MTREGFESKIVETVAELVCERVSRRVISICQSIKEANPELDNCWDEICVQVQFEQFTNWEDYDDTVRGFVAGIVNELKHYELEAVFLQTGESYDLIEDAKDDFTGCPVCIDDIVEYIVSEYVYAKAMNWSNKRIREYIDNSAF